MAAFGRLLGRKWGTVLAILGIGVYTVLAGASFSVLRADLMGSLALVAWQVGRQTGINSLRTDRNGWIELSTDGEQMWVEVERR
jgi:predicted membrane metal-binding protein